MSTIFAKLLCYNFQVIYLILHSWAVHLVLVLPIVAHYNRLQVEWVLISVPTCKLRSYLVFN